MLVSWEILPDGGKGRPSMRGEPVATLRTGRAVARSDPLLRGGATVEKRVQWHLTRS